MPPASSGTPENRTDKLENHVTVSDTEPVANTIICDGSALVNTREPSSVYQSLVVALVLSRLDYGNATLAGLPASVLNRL